MDSEVDLEQLARNLPGFTGADLANLLNEAALSALREGHPSITPFDISSAVDRVVQVLPFLAVTILLFALRACVSCEPASFIAFLPASNMLTRALS